MKPVLIRVPHDEWEHEGTVGWDRAADLLAAGGASPRLRPSRPRPWPRRRSRGGGGLRRRRPPREPRRVFLRGAAGSSPFSPGGSSPSVGLGDVDRRPPGPALRLRRRPWARLRRSSRSPQRRSRASSSGPGRRASHAEPASSATALPVRGLLRGAPGRSRPRLLFPGASSADASATAPSAAAACSSSCGRDRRASRGGSASSVPPRRRLPVAAPCLRPRRSAGHRLLRL